TIPPTPPIYAGANQVELPLDRVAILADKILEVTQPRSSPGRSCSTTRIPQ
ncbi:hypothetical protein L9F63_004732, partial [Diploptera punctata]